MRLYTSRNSPFSARIEIALRAKAISIEAAPLPAGGLRSAEFLALNPIAKIPVLAIDDGQALPESTVILRYLEDLFPEPSLLPADAAGRARMNTLAAVVDTYVMAPVIRLFPHLVPSTRDARVVEVEVACWKHGMAVLAHCLGLPLPTVHAPASFADCVIGPSLHLSRRISLMLGLEQDPADAHPSIVDYRTGLKVHPVVGPVLNELTVAQEQYDMKAGRASLAHMH